MKKTLDQTLLENLASNLTNIWEDWNKVNHHDKTNGLSQKAVNAYRREHPGSKLQTAVTTKPSKLKSGSKAAKRRKSFCARMSGNKGPMKKPNGKPTPKALALRRWNCESIEEMAQMILEGEQMIAEIKKGAKDSNGFTKCWPGHHAAGTKKGKNGGQVRNCVPNESMSETTGDKPFDTMMKSIKKGTKKQATADRREQKRQDQERTRDAIANMFGGGNPADKLSIRKKGVAEGVPQPGPSSGAPKKFGPDAKITTRKMTVGQIISSIPGVPYYNNVVDDWDAKDYHSWNVTEKAIEYAEYFKKHPESLAQLDPIIVLNGKFEDGAHRVSAIWLLQQRMDPKNPLWANAKLNVQFVKQGVAEGAQQAAIAIAKRESGKYTKDGKRKK